MEPESNSNRLPFESGSDDGATVDGDDRTKPLAAEHSDGPGQDNNGASDSDHFQGRQREVPRSQPDLEDDVRSSDEEEAAGSDSGHPLGDGLGSVDEADGTGTELQLFNQSPPGTSGAITPIGGTESRHVTTSISDRQMQNILQDEATSNTDSGWDATVDTSDPEKVHVHLTKTEIDSTAVGVGAKIVVKPGGIEKKKTDKKQANPTPLQSLRQKTESRIEDWTEGMVHTAGTQSIRDKILQGKTWLVVAGSPGEGKTTAVYLALKQLHGMGRQVYEVRTPEEYFKVKEIKGAIIMLNDILGSCQFNIGNLEMWRTVLNDIFEFKEHKDLETLRGSDKGMFSQKIHLSVVLVIRTSVLNSATDHLEKFKDLFLDSESVVDLTHGFKVSQEERFDIWSYHADVNKVDIEEKTVKEVLQMSMSHGFPHCCRLFAGMYSKNNKLSMKSFFSKPIEFLNQKITSLLAGSTAGPLLREMLKQNGCLELDSITDDERRYQYKIVVERHRGIYLSEEDSTVKFHHPSVYDSAAFVVCNIDPLFVVQHCSLSFLNERVRFKDLEKQNQTETLLTIPVASKYIEPFIERLNTEISSGNISLSLSHVSFHNDTFVERMMEALHSNNPGLSKSDFMQILMHKRDTKSNKSFLFHSTVSKSATILKYICNLVDLSSKDQTDSLFGICEHSSISALAFLLNKYENIPLNVRNSRFETPLVVASTMASAQMIKLLLLRDMDATVREMEIDYVLVNICRYGLDEEGEVVMMLTDKDSAVDINQTDINGRTPFQLACYGGHVNVMTALIDRGVDINQTDSNGTTAFHYACLRGHVNVVTALIDRGVDINQTDINGRTPFHFACLEGLLNVIIALIDRGVHINQTDINGATPFHSACIMGHLKIITVLIGKGVDINQRTKDGTTPLHCACIRGHVNVVKALIDRGVDINQTGSNGATPFHYACLKGHVNVMTVLIDRGVDINQTDSDGKTPFHYACLGGHVNVMTTLIDRGIDINQTDTNGQTSFHLACLEGHVNAVTVLIDRGVDISQAGSNGETPFHGACFRGHVNVMTALIDRGVAINQTDNEGKTPFHFACLGGHVNAVTVLLDRGVDINQTDRNGATPFQFACYGGHVNVMTTLIDRGVDINQTDSTGRTPFHFACEGGHVNVVTALIDRGLDLNKTDSKGGTPLHYACIGGHVDVVTALTDRNVDINETDSNGGTPFSYACEQGHVNVMTVLIDRGVDINQTDSIGGTPFHYACLGGHVNVVTALMDRGVDIKRPDRNGVTPFLYAFGAGHVNVMKVLMDRGVDSNAMTALADKGVDTKKTDS